MADSTQMLKGLLEGCILKIVSREETYGYEICEKLIGFGFEGIGESSVYPILIRLEKKKMMYSTMKKSALGPMRKYYNITENGVNELNNFISTWKKMKKNVERVLEV